MGDLSKKKSSLGPIKQISKSLFKNVKFDKFPLILLHKKNSFSVQDSVSNNMYDIPYEPIHCLLYF